METSFQFRSQEFNNSVPRNYFINPSCYGDDLAEWLIERLNHIGIETSAQPSQEDFGWYFTFVINDIEHCLVIGFQPNDLERGDCWIGWVERNVGLIDSVFGGRSRNILPEAIEVIDRVLNSAPEVRDLRWQTLEP